MKPLTLLIVLILTLNSCKDANQTPIDKGETTASPKTAVATHAESVKNNSKTNGTYLCKINGKDWSYTKASGIVSRDKKTKKRTAIITFTKQLDKGKEVVQLFYDGDTNQLEQANIHLKVPKTDGKTMTAMYVYHPNTNHFHPNAAISGTIDLSNPSGASGNAEVSDLDVRFDKNEIANANDKLITLEGVNFKGVGYSDSEKLFGSEKND